MAALRSVNASRSGTPVELERTVRFCLNPDGAIESDQPVNNGFAAWPAMRGLGRYYELSIFCRGEADPATGYFINIKDMDAAARSHALPIVAEVAEADDRGLGRLMGRLFEALDPALGGTVAMVTLRLTPTYALTIRGDEMSHALVSQQYEFSAAHRLHTDTLSEADNVAVFGKCNNPSGHGHNYQLEVTVRSPIEGGHCVDVVRLDELVDRVVIERFDHKHLNVDTEDFAALNPSVEHIAKVCFDLLAEPVRSLNAELDQVRVWETSKTVCTYRP